MSGWGGASRTDAYFSWHNDGCGTATEGFGGECEYDDDCLLCADVGVIDDGPDDVTERVEFCCELLS